MVAIGHTAVGAFAGVFTYQIFGETGLLPGLLAAGVTGIISHYITDFIPHGHFIKMRDYKTQIIPVIIFDLLLGIIIFLAAAFLKDQIGLRFFYILFGIGGAQLPDVLDGLIYIKALPKQGLVKYENNFHQWLHWHGRGDNCLMFGVRDIWQLSAIVISLYLVVG